VSRSKKTLRKLGKVVKREDPIGDIGLRKKRIMLLLIFHRGGGEEKQQKS